MKQIRLHMDHRCWVNGKEVVYKEGSTITVTDAVYKQITLAVKATRAQRREYFEKQVGSPEWKALQK